MKLSRIYEFFFSRWKREVVEEGEETWHLTVANIRIGESFGRPYVKYKLTNKFDGSVKIKKEYI